MTREEYVSCLNKIKESYYEIIDNSTKLNATEAFLALLVNLELIKAGYELGKASNNINLDVEMSEYGEEEE